MAGKKVPKVYWDTSVWIAHLCTETGWPERERKAVAEVFEKMRKGEAVIVSSVLVLWETVNKCEQRLGVSAQIEALRYHPSLELGDMSIKVAQFRPEPNGKRPQVRRRDPCGHRRVERVRPAVDV
ncbi:MAG: hypothetical protein AMXMBFR81_24470 [Chthonomonas sp.]